MSGESGAPTASELLGMPSRAWSLETLRAGLAAVEFQQVKDELLDHDLKDCLAYTTQVCIYIYVLYI